MSTSKEQEIKQTQETELETELAEEAEETVLSGLESLGAAAEAVEEAEDNEDDFDIPQRFTKSGRKRAVPFPLKLMKVLSNKEFNDVISWTPSGKSFSILKPKAFVADILPDHFKSAKFSSFTRKLHRWGFMRHYRGEDSGAFYHDDFQKDRLDLVEQMTCHKLEPQKAPEVKKPQAAAPNAPDVAAAALPSKPAQRLVVPGASSLPRPQPQEIAVRLHRQQQPLKLPVPEFQQQSQLDAAERLHAAIELEVNRRLQERIQAATVSRHALAMMQQQSNPLSGMNHRSLNFASPSSSLQVQLLRMQHEKKQREAACMAYGNIPLRDNKGLGQLPSTNIQGAKTA